MLGAAFADHVWTRWTVPEDRHVERVVELQRLYLERMALPHGAVWVDEQINAVAAFLPPNVSPPGDVETRVVELHGQRFSRLVAAGDLTAPHVDPSAWTLAAVGVEPACWGRGLGSAVCRAGLDDLDQRQAACALETSDPRTVGLYERLGFTTVARTPMPDGGPTVWSMHRGPQ